MEIKKNKIRVFRRLSKAFHEPARKDQDRKISGKEAIMPEKKIKIPLFGHDVEATDVPISKSTENYNEYELEDGSTIRLKVVATSILRIDGQYTPEGDPIYLVKNGQVVTVVDAPKVIRKRIKMDLQKLYSPRPEQILLASQSISSLSSSLDDLLVAALPAQKQSSYGDLPSGFQKPSPTNPGPENPDATIDQRKDPSVRKRLSGPAIRTFFNIAKSWNLTVDEQRGLLGWIAPSTYHKYKSGNVGTLTFDGMTRISLVIGIYKALHILYPDDLLADRWMKLPNSNPLFAGKPALSLIIEAGIDGLYKVRRFLDSRRGGWN